MAFALRYQPIAVFYIFTSILAMAFIRLPYWLITSIVPSGRPRRSWTLGRSLTIYSMQTFTGIIYKTGYSALLNDPEAAKRDADALGLVSFEAVPQFVQGDLKQLAQRNGVEPEPCSGYWYGDRSGGVQRRAEPGEKVVLHMHGGGFIMDTANPKKSNSAALATGLLEISAVHFKRLLGVEYRLSSSKPFKVANPFPAAVLDCLAAYSYLIDLGFLPSNILLVGDSSGGNLAQALMRYLVRNPIEELPVPRGLLLVSPTVDWTCTHSGPDSAFRRNEASDFVKVILTSQYTSRSLFGNIPPTEAESNPYLCPGSTKLAEETGQYQGFPATCFVTGGAEMTLDGMKSMRDAMARDIGDQS
ncbi:alpha/beta-hydrolase, partial [Ramaria rubella]